MVHLELHFPERLVQLEVVDVTVTEEMSELFTASVRARSADADADLDGLVGAAVELRASVNDQRERVWTGICTRAEAEHSLVEGVSTYLVDFAPTLWLLSRRENHRIFQGRTTREIVTTLLDEWGVAAEWRLDEARHPRFDYRTQYGESDLAFAARLLRDDGIVFSFSDADGHSTLVLTDAPGSETPSGEPIRHSHERSLTEDRPYATDVRRTSRATRGALALTDFDFRRPRYDLSSSAESGTLPETKHEVHIYRPGASAVRATPPVTETPFGDARGAVRSIDTVLAARAQREMERERAHKGVVTFASNVVECRAGAVVRIVEHPREDLARPLLVTSSVFRAKLEGFAIELCSVFADSGYQPAIRYGKPKVHGVQPAIVTGPSSEEIHTDELGRVSVRFPWDRAGKWDESSSCWVRVSHGWAGAGYGLFAVPRVGHEVLVAFVDGDPDEPVVVGSLHNGVQSVPCKLPEQKTMSMFRSASSPGGDGFNELRFEDRKGREHVLLRAERDLQITAQSNAAVDVGADHATQVGRDRRVTVAGDETRKVGGTSRSSVAGNASDSVMGRRTLLTNGEKNERVAAGSSTIIDGVRHEEVKASAVTAVAKDHSMSVGRSYSTVVGSEATPGSASLYVKGSHTVTATGGAVVTSDTSITLVCGASRIALTPDRVVISSPRVEVTGTDVATVRGKGPLLTLDETAELSGDEVNLYSKSASVELGVNADVDGVLVRLNSKVGAKKSAIEASDDPSTIPLKVRVGSAGGAPYAGKSYRLLVDGQKLSGTTSQSGGVSESVPKDAQTAHLTVWPEDYPSGPRVTYQLQLGSLAPASSIAGAQARLGNLGCYRGAGGGELDPETKSALRRYQETRGLKPTAELDQPTIEALEAEHDA